MQAGCIFAAYVGLDKIVPSFVSDHHDDHHGADHGDAHHEVRCPPPRVRHKRV